MSKLGKVLISTLEDAKEQGLVTLQVSPDMAALRKDLRLSQTKFAKLYHLNKESEYLLHFTVKETSFILLFGVFS